MCTPGYASGIDYTYFIQEHIDTLRTLITVEIDAISRVNRVWM